MLDENSDLIGTELLLLDGIGEDEVPGSAFIVFINGEVGETGFFFRDDGRSRHIPSASAKLAPVDKGEIQFFSL